MNIDPSKVDLQEKDIENWLYENPGALSFRYSDRVIQRWIGRQYQLPSGIADLIGVCNDGLLVVVEVKNVPINKAAILQVCRYQDDLKYIVAERSQYPHLRADREPVIGMMVVGPNIDDQTYMEAQAVNVEVLSFKVQLSLSLSGVEWTRDFRNRRRAQYEEIAARSEWDMFGDGSQSWTDEAGTQSPDDNPPDTYSDILLG